MKNILITTDISIWILILLLVGCDRLPSENEIRFGNGQLNMLGSINGLKIGDTPQKVKELLGEPTYFSEGDYDGFGYGYEFGHIAFMRIPIDTLYTITFFDVNNKYDGETINGFGIGSLRNDVLRNIRPPDKKAKISFNPNLSYIDTYYNTGSENYYGCLFNFYYDQNEKLDKISLVYDMQLSK